MGCKITKIVMIGELAIFLAIGAHYAEHQLACAQNEGMMSVYIEMPLKALQEINI